MARCLLVTLMLMGGLLAYGGGSPIWDSLLRIEQAPGLSAQQRLGLVTRLREAFERAGYPEDSVYARLLHRIAVYQYYTTREYGSCVSNTLRAIRINTSGRKNACLRFAVTSYKNMGYYYEGLMIYNQALLYFDSSILLSNRFAGQEGAVKEARQERSRIYAIKGDYEKCIEEATLGIRLGEDTHDTAYTIKLLKQRAFAETNSGLYPAAMGDIELDYALSVYTRDTAAIAGSLDVRALIDASTGHSDQSLREYNEAIRLQKVAVGGGSSSAVTGSTILAYYYLDQGNLLMEKMDRLLDAEKSYRKAFDLAVKAQDGVQAASVCIDLNVLDHHRKDYRMAILDCHLALQQLNVPAALAPSSSAASERDILRNPPFSALAALQNKQLPVIAFGNKTDDLLQFYKQTNRVEYLRACLQTALLADSLITALRHEQTDEPSKLIWRTRTREFYSNALEACWLAHDANTAFFFMEKSRAVLLNDRLNELGASAYLPADELARQQVLQLELIQQERRMADIGVTSDGYRQQQLAFLRAKDSLERYTRTLEEKAPAYYQYKYADAVPTMAALQALLRQGGRHFVHYFVNDSLIYMLAISGADARIIRVPYRNLGLEINSYLRLCSDRQAQNLDYPAFAGLSRHLYQVLVRPLGWKGGRMFVSPDNFFIPFETLTTDSAGEHFLLYDFSFDYVYSARYLLQPAFSRNGDAGEGGRRGDGGEAGRGGDGADFLGVAPANFDAFLDVPDLPQSLDACAQAASYYPSADMITEKAATRQSFLQKAGAYSVITVYAHARSDSIQREPLLFLSDSVIRLSELPLLQRPAAQLIVLSACQTNAGRSAAGEGIYSLARGFAAAGIPAVAATLWQADEQSIYSITAGFHRRLALGMDKDQALHDSKVEFIRGGDRYHSLPYFWANMILVGNTEPLVLAHRHRFAWWWLADLALLVAVFVLFRAQAVRRG